MIEAVVVVPPVPALLPEHASLTDPVADLRAGVHAALGWLLARDLRRVVVLADPPTPADVHRGAVPGTGERVARSLLAAAGFDGAVDVRPGVDALQDDDDRQGVLVMANGSACRGEKAPGHVDDRALGFDAAVESVLRSGDLSELADLDLALGTELWCSGLGGLRTLASLPIKPAEVDLTYADDPFGVRWWVLTAPRAH